MVKTLCDFGQIGGSGVCGTAPFLKPPSQLLLVLRDTLVENSDPFDRVVAALWCRDLPEGAALEFSFRRCLTSSLRGVDHI